MSNWYHKIDLDYERTKLKEIYFSRVHDRLLNGAGEEDKKLHHLGTPGFGQDILKMFPSKFYTSCVKFFNKIGNTFNISNEFVARFFLVAPNDVSVIHIDTYAGKQEIRQWALNFPVYNTDNNFHEIVSIDSTSKQFNETNPMYLWNDANRFEIIDSMILDQPTLIDVSIPHRINNPTDDYRVVLSIRSKDNSISYKSIKKKI